MSKEAYNFHQIKFTADEKKINYFEILKKAFNLNMFEVEEKDKNLLFNFINSLKEKNESFKSQLYQDVFADYLIKNEDRKTCEKIFCDEDLLLPSILSDKKLDIVYNIVLIVQDLDWYNIYMVLINLHLYLLPNYYKLYYQNQN